MKPRLCPGCGNEFPPTLDFFYRNTSAKSGLSLRCKDCVKKRVKHWNDVNPERYKTRVKNWHRDNPGRAREIKRNWKHRNAERVRESNRRYKAERPEQVSLTYHRRAARKRNLPSNFTIDDWSKALNYFAGRCAYCGRQQGLWNCLCADHFVPLTDPSCPGTVPQNMLPACNECNASKNDNPAEDWASRKFGKRKAKQILARIHEYFAGL